jgi:hypothetical protein
MPDEVTPRRFPPPWTVEDNGACFIVKDHAGMALAYVYYDPPLQAADVLAYEGGKFLKNPTGTPRRAWTALDPDKTRIIARRYGKDDMSELIRLLTNFREKLLAEGWDGKIE